MSNEIEEAKEESPWSFIAVAVFLFALAWWLHSFFTNLELSGESVRINAIIAMLYKVFGKWGAVGLFGVFGGVSLVIGIRGLRKA